jgi:hypothetical protein
MALPVGKLADALVRGRIASLEDRQTAWPYPGRKRMFFCAERDVHEGSLRAVMLAELPAAVRRTEGPADARRVGAARHHQGGDARAALSLADAARIRRQGTRRRVGPCWVLAIARATASSSVRHGAQARRGHAHTPQTTREPRGACGARLLGGAQRDGRDTRHAREPRGSGQGSKYTRVSLPRRPSAHGLGHRPVCGGDRPRRRFADQRRITAALMWLRTHEHDEHNRAVPGERDRPQR